MKSDPPLGSIVPSKLHRNLKSDVNSPGALVNESAEQGSLKLGLKLVLGDLNIRTVVFLSNSVAGNQRGYLVCRANQRF